MSFLGVALQQKLKIEGKVKITVYQKNHHPPVSLLDEYSLNRQNLVEESVCLKSVVVRYNYQMNINRIDFWVAYHDGQPKNVFSGVESKFSLSFFPNSTFLNKTLIYT